MELQLFPSMALRALEAIGTTFVVLSDEVVRPPVGTWFWFIVVLVRRSSEVLPVVGIDAEGFFMRSEVEGTPDGLVVEHEKVGIVDEVVNQLNLHFVFVVGEGAEVAVLALLGLVKVGGAELHLVLIRPVQLLHPVVRIRAVFAFHAVCLEVMETYLHFSTEILRVEVAGSFPVELVVVKRALLVVMLLLTGRLHRPSLHISLS